jgi:hypothetical protein
MQNPVSLLGLALLAGCSRTPEEPRGHEPAVSAASVARAQAAPANAPGSGSHDVVWSDPAGWQRVTPSSSMRKASYKVPRRPKDAEDVEVAVFYFGSEAGGTEANIQRWMGQFPSSKPSDAKRTERTVKGMKQTIVEVEGTYASGMPGGESTPKPAFRLLGAVVETPKGNYFFKMTGPTESVARARDAFYGMLDSVHQE